MPPLTELQLRTLVAAIDRIVPADDFPSASQAGCDNFLVRLIELEQLVETYRTGLDGLDTAAMKSGKSFAECSVAQQDEILEESHRAEAMGAFVDLLVQQTIEGYYADPGNGGNRGGISWEMVGFKVTA
jgi:hypothetical protein